MVHHCRLHRDRLRPGAAGEQPLAGHRRLPRRLRLRCPAADFSPGTRTRARTHCQDLRLAQRKDRLEPLGRPHPVRKLHGFARPVGPCGDGRSCGELRPGRRGLAPADRRRPAGSRGHPGQHLRLGQPADRPLQRSARLAAGRRPAGRIRRLETDRQPGEGHRGGGLGRPDHRDRPRAVVCGAALAQRRPAGCFTDAHHSPRWQLPLDGRQRLDSAGTAAGPAAPGGSRGAGRTRARLPGVGHRGRAAGTGPGSVHRRSSGHRPLRSGRASGGSGRRRGRGHRSCRRGCHDRPHRRVLRPWTPARTCPHGQRGRNCSSTWPSSTAWSTPSWTATAPSPDCSDNQLCWQPSRARRPGPGKRMFGQSR